MEGTETSVKTRLFATPTTLNNPADDADVPVFSSLYSIVNVSPKETVVGDIPEINIEGVTNGGINSIISSPSPFKGSQPFGLTTTFNRLASG